MDGNMTFVVDDGIPTMLLIEALNELGLTISNVGGFRFRLHPLKSTEDVIARLQRRRDARTDRQIRAGMRHLRLVDNGTNLLGAPAPGPDAPGGA